MRKLREYQIKNAERAVEIIKKYGIAYLAMEVRTGKTVTAFETAKLLGVKNVIFTTRKRAVKGISEDYINFGYNEYFNITIINNESLHKIERADFELLISDEHHRAGAFPKPTKTAKDLRNRFGHLPIVCLSGTPHPESLSQLYHQFWVKKGFWKNDTTFYKWFKIFGLPQKRHLGYAEVNVYDTLNDKGENLIKYMRKELFVTFTQNQAGFETSVNKNIIHIEEDDYLTELSNRLMKDRYLTIANKEVVADTAVKLQTKVHQIENGSIITECGEAIILSDFKAYKIKNLFMNKKLAIFYYYKAEWQILKNLFGDDLTSDLEEFNLTNKHIALQQVSGSEGISLKSADVLVYYNFGFSNVKFTQGIDRLTTMERKSNDVYFIFNKKSINSKIYQALMDKKSYITSAFKNDYKL